MVKQRLSRCANQSNRPVESPRPFVQSNSQDLPLCHTRCVKTQTIPAAQRGSVIAAKPRRRE
ncbi:hypothetical protein [Azospirillum argentinense]